MATTRKNTTKKSTAKSKKPSAAKVNKTKTTAAKVSSKKTVTKKVPAKKPVKLASTKSSTKTTKSTAALPVIKQQSTRSTSDLLKIWNLVLAAAHAIQAGLILWLANHATLPVTSSYVTTDSLSSSDGNILAPAVRNITDVRIAYVISVMFGLFALTHLVSATIAKDRYDSDIKQQFNRLRWFGFALGGAALMVLLAMITGISDLASLVMIGGLTAIASLSALAWEYAHHVTDRASRLSGWVALIAWGLPWVVFGRFILDSSRFGEVNLNNSTYVLLGSMFIVSGFAALYSWISRSRDDYVYTEKVYMLIAAVAATATAWQIYYSILR